MGKEGVELLCENEENIMLPIKRNHGGYDLRDVEDIAALDQTCFDLNSPMYVHLRKQNVK